MGSSGSVPLRQHQLQHYGANRRQFHLLPPLNQILHPLPFLGPFHAKNKLSSRLPSRTRLNNFENFSAKKQSYSANRRHQQIRRREGSPTSCTTLRLLSWVRGGTLPGSLMRGPLSPRLSRRVVFLMSLLELLVTNTMIKKIIKSQTLLKKKKKKNKPTLKKKKKKKKKKK